MPKSRERALCEVPNAELRMKVGVFLHETVANRAQNCYNEKSIYGTDLREMNRLFGDRCAHMQLGLCLLAAVCLLRCAQETSNAEQPKEDYARARALLEQGRWAAARKALQALVDRDDANAVAWADLAHVHYRNQHYGKAVVAARRAAQIDPTLAEAHATLGMALVRQSGRSGPGRGNEPIAALERAVQLKSDLAEAWSALGAIHLQRGDLRAARKELTAAIGCRPTLPEANFNLALVYEELDRRKPGKAMARAQALLYFEKFLALEDGPAALRAHARNAVDRLKR